MNYNDAQLTEDGWLILNKRDETGASVDELELRLSDYSDIEDALSSNGYELAGDWEDFPGGSKFADIWAL